VSHLNAVQAVAKRLQLLDAKGDLIELDSLSLVDFVLALEKALKRSIPPSKIRNDDFRTLAAVDALLTRLQA